MKNIILTCGALALLGAAPALAADNNGQNAQKSEIGYESGSLGFAALNSGDNADAIQQINANDGFSDKELSLRDPAKLMNLAAAYWRMGDLSSAQMHYEAVRDNRTSFDLVLADGRVVNSRDAAREALGKLNIRIASK